MLAAAVRDAGAAVVATATAGDDVAQFGAILDRYAVDADLIITSGGVSAGAYEVVKDAFGSADYREATTVSNSSRWRCNPECPRASGGWQVRRSSPFPATRSARWCPSRCSSVPAAHGHGPAGSVPAAPKRGTHREPDIAARQTSVPTRNTRSPGRHGHQLRPTGVAPFALVGIGQRTSGHPGGRRGGGCRNAAASLGLDLTGPILVPCTQPAARSSVR